jgi:hypothetical protein
MSARYVLLGLARARAGWFGAVAGWATTAALPADFVKCVSVEELRARLASGRVFSAALVDGSLPALDRDLVEEARAAGIPIVAVDDGRHRRDWRTLGVAAVLPDAFDRAALVDVLGRCARPVDRADAVPGEPVPAPPPRWRGSLVAVCGPGGTGASTVAVALAQGMADDIRVGRSVLLADFCLRAEQAVLHDARDVVPGVQELVDAHRSGRPSAEELRSFTYAVPERGYRLLLGLRQARLWSTLRPRAVDAAVDSLRVGFRIVVCDTDADVEGEADAGSSDMEDRNVLARTAACRADVVFVVGAPGLKGLHALVRVLADLRAFGVAPERLVPVVNRAPRSRRARAELARALHTLLAPMHGRRTVASALFLPERRVDDALRDGARLPHALTEPLVGAYHAVLGQVGTTTTVPTAEPQLVRPGSLGVWADEEESAG